MGTKKPVLATGTAINWFKDGVEEFKRRPDELPEFWRNPQLQTHNKGIATKYNVGKGNVSRTRML